MPYDPSTPDGKVRLLINDVDPAREIFTDLEIATFLEMSNGRIKRAAALALDTIANNEALCSKVIRTQDVQTDGAKLADALRKGAAALRRQDDEDADEESGFQIVGFRPYGPRRPELTEYPGWVWPGTW